ncbi:hypothetical protein WDV85_01160 [Pseudokineococcus sp. 5B2Z-1]|uniref:hypothetical protein n=1 Tax=Pseudokineococcus sp. 5B2Z-1 TaxID=3132744 RepID=UPI0030A41676
MTSAGARTAAVSVALAAPLLLPGPAAASCAGPATPSSLLAQDGGVVLARAADVDGHRVVLAVEEVWSGEDRAPRVRITTGETRRGAEGSGDVELVEGDTYLLALRGDHASVCSVLVVGDGRPVAAVATTAQVAAARPEGARPPVEGADAGDAPGPPLAALAAGLVGWVALTAVVLLAGRSVRRRQQRRSRHRRGGASADGAGRPLR